MGKKFVLSDLDGTLLDQIDSLSPQYIDELNKLIDMGLNFSIATGRDLKKARKAVLGLKIKYPVILTNGALLGDLNTMEYLKITSIEHSIMTDILQMALNLQIIPMVFGAFDSNTKTMYFNKGKWGIKGIIPLTPDKYLPYQDYQVVTMQFHTRKELLDPLKANIESKYKGKVNIIYIEDVGYRNETKESGWYWLEINSSQAGKDKMLNYLVDLLGFSLDDVVVFGDNYNDIDMLRAAGSGIVVANAPMEVKAVAKEICESNLDGGVIKYLKQNIKKFL